MSTWLCHCLNSLNLRRFPHQEGREGRGRVRKQRRRKIVYRAELATRRSFCSLQTPAAGAGLRDKIINSIISDSMRTKRPWLCEEFSLRGCNVHDFTEQFGTSGKIACCVRFTRSCLYAIGIVLSSVCLSVTLCIVALRGDWKLYQCVPIAGKFLFVRSFCSRVHRLASKASKSTSRRKRELSFLRQTIRRALVVLWRRLPFHRCKLWVRLHPLNRIVRTSRSSTCNRNRFDSLPVRRMQYDRLSQQQLSYLFL